MRLDADTKISPDLALAFFTVRADDKPAALLYLLREVLPASQPTIVFTCELRLCFWPALLLRHLAAAAAVQPPPPPF